MNPAEFAALLRLAWTQDRAAFSLTAAAPAAVWLAALILEAFR